jgi:hypothetical protein
MAIRRARMPTHLGPAQQMALAAFLAGRLPAGQLHAELCRAREQVPAPQAGGAEPPLPGAALRAA